MPMGDVEWDAEWDGPRESDNQLTSDDKGKDGMGEKKRNVKGEIRWCEIQFPETVDNDSVDYLERSMCEDEEEEDLEVPRFVKRQTPGALRAMGEKTCLYELHRAISYRSCGCCRQVYNTLHGSCFILPPPNLSTAAAVFRLRLIRFVDDVVFDRCILVLILVNSIQLCLDTPGFEHSTILIEMLSYIDITFLVCYTGEMLLKSLASGFVRHRFSYLRNSWNQIDFFIIIMSFAEYGPWGANASGLRTLRLARVLRPLRTISRVQGMRVIVSTLVESISSLVDAFTLLLFFLVIFAILGIKLFAGSLHKRCFVSADVASEYLGTNVTESWLVLNDTQVCGKGRSCNDNGLMLPQECTTRQEVYKQEILNFDNMGSALLLVYKLISLDDWPGDMNMLQNAESHEVWIYFFTVTVLGGFFCINLVLAVLSATFHKSAIGDDLTRAKMLVPYATVSTTTGAIMLWPGLAFAFPPSQYGILIKYEQKKDEEAPSEPDETELKTLGVEMDVVATSTPSTEEEEEISTWRRPFRSLVQSTAFNRAMLSITIFNIIIMASVFHMMPEEMSTVFDTCNFMCSVVFAFELLLKLVGLSVRRYFKDSFNAFDFLLVLVSIPDMIDGPSGGGGTFSSFRILRMARLARILKLANRMEALRRLLSTLSSSLAAVCSLSGLLFLFLFIFSILGSHLFGNSNVDVRPGFDNLWSSALTVFVVITGESWGFTMKQTMKATSPAACIYFIALFTFGNYILINLFIAILIDNFGSHSDLEDTSLNPLQDSYNPKEVVKYLRAANASESTPVSTPTPGSPAPRTFYDVIVKMMQSDAEGAWEDRDDVRRYYAQRDQVIYLGSEAFASGSGRDYGGVDLIVRPKVDDCLSLQLRDNFRKDFIQRFRDSTDDELHKYMSKNPRTLEPGVPVMIPQTLYPLNSEQTLHGVVGEEHILHFDPSDGRWKLKRDFLREVYWDYIWSLSAWRELPAVLINRAPLLVGGVGISKPVNDLAIRCSIDGVTWSEVETSSCQVAEVVLHVFEKPIEARHVEVHGSFGASTMGALLLANEMALKDRVTAYTVDFDCSGGRMGEIFLREHLVSTEPKTLRGHVARFILHPGFELFVIFLIVLNAVVLSLNDPSLKTKPKMSRVVSTLDIIITVLFFLEMVLKMWVFGIWKGESAYLRDTWNRLDCFVVFTATIAIGFKDLFFFRALRVIRLVVKSREVKLIISSLLEAVPAMGNVLLICSFAWLIFGCVGIQLFMGSFYHCTDASVEEKANCTGTYEHVITDAFSEQTEEREREWVHRPPCNFDHIGAAIECLFECAIGEGWATIMLNGIDSRGPSKSLKTDSRPYLALYFIFFAIVGQFIAMNLFIGVLIDKFAAQKARNEGSLCLSHRQQDWVRAQKLLRHLDLLCHPPFKVTKGTYGAIKKSLYVIVTNEWFDISVMGIILLNVGIMAMEHDNMGPTWTEFLDTFSYVFFAFYVVEAAMRIMAFSFAGYISDRWNRFDFTIILLSLVQFMLGSRTGSSATAVRVVRVGRMFRLVNKWHGLRALFQTLVGSIPHLINIALLLGVVFFCYGVVGVNLFGELATGGTGRLHSHSNFKTLYYALATLYQVSTTETWTDVMDACSLSPPLCSEDGHDCGPHPFWVSLYFHSFMVVGSFIILNLFITVVLDQFGDMMEQLEHAYIFDAFNLYRDLWVKARPNGESDMQARLFLKFLVTLPQPLWTRLPSTTLNMVLSLSEIPIPVNKDHSVEFRHSVMAFAVRLFGLNISQARQAARFIPGAKLSEFEFYIVHWYCVDRIATSFLRHKQTRQFRHANEALRKEMRCMQRKIMALDIYEPDANNRCGGEENASLDWESTEKCGRRNEVGVDNQEKQEVLEGVVSSPSSAKGDMEVASTTEGVSTTFGSMSLCSMTSVTTSTATTSPKGDCGHEAKPQRGMSPAERAGMRPPRSPNVPTQRDAKMWGDPLPNGIGEIGKSPTPPPEAVTLLNIRAPNTSTSPTSGRVREEPTFLLVHSMQSVVSSRSSTPAQQSVPSTPLVHGSPRNSVGSESAYRPFTPRASPSPWPVSAPSTPRSLQSRNANSGTLPFSGSFSSPHLGHSPRSVSPLSSFEQGYRFPPQQTTQPQSAPPSLPTSPVPSQLHAYPVHSSPLASPSPVHEMHGQYSPISPRSVFDQPYSLSPSLSPAMSPIHVVPTLVPNHTPTHIPQPRAVPPPVFYMPVQSPHDTQSRQVSPSTPLTPKGAHLQSQSSFRTNSPFPGYGLTQPSPVPYDRGFVQTPSVELSGWCPSPPLSPLRPMSPPHSAYHPLSPQLMPIERPQVKHDPRRDYVPSPSEPIWNRPRESPVRSQSISPPRPESRSSHGSSRSVTKYQPSEPVQPSPKRKKAEKPKKHYTPSQASSPDFHRSEAVAHRSEGDSVIERWFGKQPKSVKSRSTITRSSSRSSSPEAWSSSSDIRPLY